MKFSAIIGLEIHVQLATQSKMFCRCANDSEQAAPNTLVCPVCLGLPGALPVPNRTAIEWSLQTARALGCAMPEHSHFDRKQYFYPDSPKGYQISQNDQPFGGPGAFEFDLTLPGGAKRTHTIGITRLHLEEDSGKLTHPAGRDYSLVDLNRAGTPLMEIVTDPIEIADPDDAPAIAKAFLQELRLVMRYLEVSEADMEKGHLRCDANISLHPTGATEWGQKVEIKNMNSFKFVERGLQAEIIRQRQLLENGEIVEQETRGFDEATGTTYSQRSKEAAHDYRYFPDPDLPPFDVSSFLEAQASVATPELPVAKRRRWRDLGVAEEVIAVVVPSAAESAAFEEVLERQDAVLLSKLWLTARGDFKDVTALQQFASEAAPLLASGQLSSSHLKKLATTVASTGQPLADVVSNDPAFQALDETALLTAVQAAIAANPQAVSDYQAGNLNARQAIVGAVMKATKGSANPTRVLALISESLEDNPSAS